MTRASDQRAQRIVNVLVIIMVMNLAVAVAKLAYAARSGALALSADGLHSILDSASNVIGLVGVWIARRPPDENHPYGHRKVETFAALGVVMMMLFGCWEIVQRAFERLQAPAPPTIGPGGFAVVIGTLVVNVIVAALERREGVRLQSEMLIADSAHTSSDVAASLVVLASFGAARLGWPHADVIAAGVVVVLIVRAGIEILSGTLSTLADERRVDPAEVERVALLEPGVREVHNVRSRGALDDIHVDLHVLVDPIMAIADAHQIGHRVENRLKRHWPTFHDVVVHVEPALASERATQRLGGGLKADS